MKKREYSKEFIFTLLLILIPAFLYYMSVFFPFMNLDDNHYVTENLLIRDFSWQGIGKLFTTGHFYLYIPVTLMSYVLDYKLFVLNAFGYHFVNMLIHLCNIILVYTVLSKLFKKNENAFWVALFFAIHPVQIESVVWVSGRKTLLMAFFFLGSFLFFIRYREKGKITFYLASLISFILACLSKPNAVVLPILFIAYDFFYGVLKQKKIVETIPFFLVSAAIALVTIQVGGVERALTYPGESFAYSLLLLPVLLMKYFINLVFPFYLSMVYIFPVYKSLLEPPVIVGLAGILAFLVSLYFVFKKDSQKWFGLFWFLILMLPVLNLVPQPDLMADRHLYLSCIGIFFVLILFLEKVLSQKINRIFLTLFALVFLGLSFQRQNLWSSPEKLWLDTISKAEKPAQISYQNLGNFYLTEGRIDEAIIQLEKAKEIKATAKVLGALGVAHMKKDLYLEAIDYLNQAIEKDSHNSLYYLNLGIIYYRLGQNDLALESYLKGEMIDPDDVMILINLANLHAIEKQDAVAEAYFKRVEAIDPKRESLLVNYGFMLWNQGKRVEAAVYLKKALKYYSGPGYILHILDILKQLTPEEDAASQLN